jgi:hypothetical protein
LELSWFHPKVVGVKSPLGNVIAVFLSFAFNKVVSHERIHKEIFFRAGQPALTCKAR